MSIFVAIIIVAIFASSLIASQAVHATQGSVGVGEFLRDAIDQARTETAAALTIRSGGKIPGLAYNIGVQTVMADAAAASAPNALLIQPAQNPFSDGLSSVAIFPETGFGDIVFRAKFKADSSSSSTWRVGLLYGYQDAENFQYLSMRTGHLEVRQEVSGVESTIANYDSTFNAGTWYELKVTTSGSTISVYLNGTLKGTISGTAPFGHLGFIGFNAAAYRIDDVSLASSLKTATWNFDASPFGLMPDGFLQKAPNGLDRFNAVMTIAKYNGNDALLDVAADGSWYESGRLRRLRYETIIYAP